KGLGFRGRILGKMLKYHCELKKDELYVHGMKKQDDARIQVVTLDMFTFGWFFPELKDMKKTYLLPHFLRDILAIYGYKYFGK
ncbi:MAG: bifunctional metallophosphatase/5'-nucleotidase, partial [Kurthia sp.]|nr:bifunctional metallophosphatase/5'-nucleotidase [Kurthia sp.]